MLKDWQRQEEMNRLKEQLRKSVWAMMDYEYPIASIQSEVQETINDWIFVESLD